MINQIKLNSNASKNAKTFLQIPNLRFEANYELNLKNISRIST